MYVYFNEILHATQREITGKCQNSSFELSTDWLQTKACPNGGLALRRYKKVYLVYEYGYIYHFQPLFFLVISSIYALFSSVMAELLRYSILSQTKISNGLKYASSNELN